MAYEPYLFDRFMGCYKAPRVPKPEPDPACTIDKYTQSFRDRWNLIRQDPCSKVQFTALNDACCALDSSVKTCEDLCINPGLWANGQTLYSKDFKFPKSHNDVDDCCSAPCPCADELPDYSRDSKNVAYCPNQPYQRPYPPLESCTTYASNYCPHDVKPRWRWCPEKYDPCECPMEESTITRTDFPRKNPIPNGPANSEVIKHGLWSCSQFCKDFTDETTTGVEYGPKCGCRPPAIRHINNLISPCYPLKSDTETASEFTYKEGEPTHCFHTWLDNENWHKPETPLEQCTSYKHFYPPRSFPPPMTKCTVESPPAIPFCSMNRLCYSCYDPVPNQKTPVVMMDNDPWPYVKPCPIRYQNNLLLDPCAKFRDETTQKADYTAKNLCRRTKSFAPLQGYVAPITPFNDDTTMKISYPAYSQEQYQYSKTYAGNPAGVRWGLNQCPDRKNKCLPRFPSPYGDPLKPYNCQNNRCPCGPFDDRTTYKRAFLFRSKDEDDALESDRCMEINVPKGVSLYRFDFVPQGGKKAERMPPPISKGHRCMKPTNLKILDSLYRLSYSDFWKSYKREDLEMHRGKPTIRTRRHDQCKKDDGCCQDNGDEEPVLYQPILIKVPKKRKTSACPRPCQSCQDPCNNPSGDADAEEMRRCRQIPYSGQNIINHAATSLICDGHDGQ